MMKAAIFHGPGKALQIESLPIPIPGDGEVLIKVGRCGICGSDVQMTSGNGFTFPTGIAMGHEYAGEIVALGRGVEGLRVGERITAMPAKGCGRCSACLVGRPLACAAMEMMMGGFGEYTRVDARMAVRLPQSLSLADGALVEPLACSLRGVALAQLKRGDRVLVLGAGSIGLGAVYWARHLGAGSVACAARSAWRGPLALEQGADHFLVADEQLPDSLLNAFGSIADVVFECTGAPGMLARAVELVRPGGSVIGLGLCSGHDHFVPAMAAAKDLTLRFTTGYALDDFHHVVDTLSRGSTEPRLMVGDTITLQALPEALEKMREQQLHCKVMVDPGQA
jgi:(R,R)-butanediol dehydrogenase/meso-butanediol dehydrogenase/diacetyl reductase